MSTGESYNHRVGVVEETASSRPCDIFYNVYSTLYKIIGPSIKCINMNICIVVVLMIK
jgi:hypothetical protein